jgi:hypothetical protein
LKIDLISFDQRLTKTTMEEIFIWYHPLKDVYEKGTRHDYDQTLRRHPDLDLIYEFTAVSARLIDKVLEQLNLSNSGLLAQAS